MSIVHEAVCDGCGKRAEARGGEKSQYRDPYEHPVGWFIVAQNVADRVGMSPYYGYCSRACVALDTAHDEPQESIGEKLSGLILNGGRESIAPPEPQVVGGPYRPWRGDTETVWVAGDPRLYDLPETKRGPQDGEMQRVSYATSTGRYAPSDFLADGQAYR